MSRSLVTVEKDGEVVYAVDADCVTDFHRTSHEPTDDGWIWWTVYMASGVGRVVSAPKDFGERLLSAIEGRR